MIDHATLAALALQPVFFRGVVPVVENVINVIAGVLGVYFVIAMLMFFHWFYFRKGSPRKSLIHIGISVVLLCAVAGVQMLRWQSINAEQAAETAAQAPQPVAIAPELLDILKANTDPASLDPSQVAALAALADQRLGEAGTQHAAALKQYFVYYHSKLADKKMPENVAGIEFDSRRRNAERKP